MTRARQALAMALMGTLAWPALAQHWGYAGEAGPEHWAKLDPGFALCASGRNQSPIDLAGFVDAKLAPLVIAYRAGAAEIVNNGHTVQVDYAPGSALGIDGRRFELKQFHFHAPSENRIAGKQYALEAHLVHGDAKGDLAVASASRATRSRSAWARS